MTLEHLVGDARTLAIVCNQWGDTGKGKFVDYFAAVWADIVARGTGGANAGHTIVVDGKQLILHLIPSGIQHDHAGKINVIGTGVAVDPREVIKELTTLDAANVSYNNLMIAHDAKLVLPQHLLIERLKEMLAGKKKIGTTGRGIGEVYGDHVLRVGLTVNDLLNPDRFREKLARNLQAKMPFLRSFDRDTLEAMLQTPALGDGTFFDKEHLLNSEAIIDAYLRYGQTLDRFVHDTKAFLRERLGKSKILLEGAQGFLLSIDHGAHPYVTSSDCSIQGLARGVGLREHEVDKVLGIVKAFYMTRVGEGAFPTEFGGEQSATWCEAHKRGEEEAQFPDVSVNDPDPFRQGIAIRRAGHEYGATTGRPRRTGWLDLPLLRAAAAVNGREVILTKVDVLNDCEDITICTHHHYKGPEIRRGKQQISDGALFDHALVQDDILRHCEPVYQTFPGWMSDISACRTYEALPAKLRVILEYVERTASVRVRMIGVGPERHQTIFKP